MTLAPAGASVGYEGVYRDFDSPLMRQIRREAYGEDIGQHSWVGADELRADIDRLSLSAESTLLDLGCGPAGPLTFVVASAGCRGTGIDVSPHAIRAAQARARTLGVDARVELREVDLNGTLPFGTTSFDAAMSLDVVLHLRDRLEFFRETARVLRPAGRFLFTDAGVVTGTISSDEIRARSAHGSVTLVAPGANERFLHEAGFQILEIEDRTPSVLRNGSGRLSALRAHRAELEDIMPSAEFDREVAYLETVLALAARRALARMMYLAAKA